jgi:hypothetical protein
MRTILLIAISIFYLNAANAQSESFGILKFKIPPGWQEQIRQHVVAYTGVETESNLPLEIVIYENQPAGIKPDSSFKMEWQRILNSDYGNPVVPIVKKSYNPAGLQVVLNTPKPVEITTNNEKKYTQLVVFIIDKQMQAIQFISNNAANYRLLHYFIEDFIESVDTIEKRKN